MRNRSVQHISTIEEEIKSLKDMGLSLEEKMAILEILMLSAHTEEDRAKLQEVADVLAVESILLGNDDE